MAKRTYEILHPIRLAQDEEPKTEGTISLEEEDARTFLDRGVIRPLLTSGDGGDGGATNHPGDPGENTPPSELAGLLGDELAATLESAGYTSADQVRGASSEELDAVNGIGSKALQKIRSALG